MKRVILSLTLIIALTAAFESSAINKVLPSEWTEFFQKGSSTTVKASKKKATIRNTVGAFSKIENVCSADVSVVRGNANEVEISGPDNVVGLLSCDVGGSTLKIRFKKNVSVSIGDGCPDLKIKVTMRSALSSVRNAGSGDFECDKTVDWSNDAKIMSSGSGDISIKSIRSESLKVQMAGSADMKIDEMRSTSVSVMMSGSGDFESHLTDCDVLNFMMSGSGDAKNVKMKCRIANFMLSGSGDAVVKDLDCSTLNVMSSGSGSSRLAGQCVSANYTVSGTGDINAKEMTAKSVNVRATGPGDVLYSKPKL